MAKVKFEGKLSEYPDVRFTMDREMYAVMYITINSKSNIVPVPTIRCELTFTDDQVDSKAHFALCDLDKGDGIAVVGETRVRQWRHRDTGRMHTQTYLVADQIAFKDASDSGVVTLTGKQ